MKLILAIVGGLILGWCLPPNRVWFGLFGLLLIVLSQYVHASENPDCVFQQRVADFAIYHARRGLSHQEFFQKHKIPVEWAQDKKLTAIKIVKEAYEWPRGEQDFVDYIRKDCQYIRR